MLFAINNELKYHLTRDHYNFSIKLHNGEPVSIPKEDGIHSIV